MIKALLTSVGSCSIIIEGDISTKYPILFLLLDLLISFLNCFHMWLCLIYNLIASGENKILSSAVGECTILGVVVLGYDVCQRVSMGLFAIVSSLIDGVGVAWSGSSLFLSLPILPSILVVWNSRLH